MATAKKRTVAKTSALDKKFSQRTRATEKHYIPNYPTKLFIYKQAASKYWWVRYFVNGNAVRKTTRTESKREAIAFAKSFYDTVTYNQRHGISATLSATSFAACLKEMLKAEKDELKIQARQRERLEKAKLQKKKLPPPSERPTYITAAELQKFKLEMLDMVGKPQKVIKEREVEVEKVVEKPVVVEKVVEKPTTKVISGNDLLDRIFFSK